MTTIPKVSFEFFPPKDEAAEERLWEVIHKLAPLEPAFVSVTYGAGGSTRQRTDRIVRRIHAEAPVEPAAHLTCVGATRDETNALAQSWYADGIRHIVALRGDPPKEATHYSPHPGGYLNAADLCKGLRAIGDFELSVAGYPEKHPDSPSVEADIDNIKAKVDAGATRIVTQYFFENEDFLRYRDLLDKAGVRLPLVPGIMPVTNFKKIKSFSLACGASVPDWLEARFEGLDDDPDTRKLIAASTAVEQCEELLREGADAFHFYTLNRADLTYAICWRLGLRPAEAGAEAVQGAG